MLDLLGGVGTVAVRRPQPELEPELEAILGLVQRGAATRRRGRRWRAASIRATQRSAWRGSSCSARRDRLGVRAGAERRVRGGGAGAGEFRTRDIFLA